MAVALGIGMSDTTTNEHPVLEADEMKNWIDDMDAAMSQADRERMVESMECEDWLAEVMAS